MKIQSASFALLFLVSLQASASDSQVVVNRGLSQVNLNDSSGELRCNVRWSGDENGFVGDDFSIGAPGEKWVIDAIRTWAVPQIAVNSNRQLGDLFQDVRLYLGPAETALTPVAAAVLAPGGNHSDNPQLKVSELTDAGAIPYDDRGTALRVWQVEFSGVNKVVEGGRKYGFGVWGMGRQMRGGLTKPVPWFNLATNAKLSSVPQDGADDTLLLYDGGGKFEGTFDSKGTAWDKSSDINVQIFAHKVAN